MFLTIDLTMFRIMKRSQDLNFAFHISPVCCEQWETVYSLTIYTGEGIRGL